MWADEFFFLVWVVWVFDTLISFCGTPPGYFTVLDSELGRAGPGRRRVKWRVNPTDTVWP